ncbi:hypothetical protein [Mycobacterium paragordonae]|uniref:EcsC family protein n=1 Tax=Mycobacterium paragordonae TaxID=1389713 RepID=A0AAJ1W1Z6_9MYCO|nr:hypothetical protein [Mycobacterium paragordonae]MDP7735108.1 hypothetical protein [Mycobacterium paragordonae]
MDDDEDHGPSDESESSRALELVNKILAVGVDGLGPYKSARQIADEALATHGDTEVAIRRLIQIHRRWVTSSGFATGLGGLMALPVAVPTDITLFYALSARMAAAIAVLRGVDRHGDGTTLTRV